MLLKDWIKEWRLLLGLILMIIIAIVVTIVILRSSDQIPWYLIVILVGFGAWMLEFLVKYREGYDIPE